MADHGKVQLAGIPTWKEYFRREDFEKFETSSADDVDEALADKVSIIKGDITKLQIDAIVNAAANNSLLSGGGIDGVIHRAAGQGLKKECKKFGPGPDRCQTGDAKITSGHKLPARFVIHTVGPKGEEPDLLRGCYESSLELMLANRFQTKLRSIAFPGISIGTGYPPENAASVAVRAIKEFVKRHKDKIDRVVFCVLHDNDLKIYEREMLKMFPIKAAEKAKDIVEQPKPKNSQAGKPP